LGAKAEIMVGGMDAVDLKKLLYLLWQRGVNRLMVEGGATLNWSLLSQELVDEVFIYVGNIIIGGEGAPTPVDGSGFLSEEAMTNLELLSTERIDEGVLLRWRVRK
jgi:2,5-diamino-6-(ribosylamino)-4(3H)-pyrimidinone 5'-phosphate reductase